MRKHTYMLLSWALSLVGGWQVFAGHIMRLPSSILCYAIEKASATLTSIVPTAEWKLVERICSLRNRQSLSVFSRDSSSTGALSNPLLS